MDWDAIADKLGTAFLADPNPLVTQFTAASGASTTKLKPSEIASAITIARNQAAHVDRESNGIMSRVEMDPLE